VVLVVTGPIASGKSTLARAVACELGSRGTKAAAVDLDLIYEILDPQRAPKNDLAKWAQARRVAARLTAALLVEGVDVVVEGEFLTACERAEFTAALPRGIQPHFVTLLLSYDLALQRASRDQTRGLSRDPVFLRDHYEAATRVLRDVPSTDLTLDTGAIGVAQASRFVVDWAARQQT
jgi:adenylylsulfate kinase-like enzyme